jgi:hypothetical protein
MVVPATTIRPTGFLLSAEILVSVSQEDWHNQRGSDGGWTRRGKSKETTEKKNSGNGTCALFDSPSFHLKILMQCCRVIYDLTVM